jgi:hypothetical protein
MFTLKSPEPKPTPPPKYIRPTKEREETPQERRSRRQAEVIHGLAPGGRDRDSAPIHEDEAWFRHHNWKEKRSLVIKALQASGTSSRGLDNFQNCGAECVIEWSEIEQKHRLRGSYCHNRHCEPCMRAKANLLAANLRNRLESQKGGDFRFVTLTLRHTDTPLMDQIKRLNKCFAKLRSRKLWKNSQRGGCAILEIKWNAEKQKWHPHLHIISDGGFIKNFDLSEEWLHVTGDSSIVDIRRLSSEKDAAHYVAKYMSKGTNQAVWNDPAAAIEWVVATRGVRTCATFGTWRGFQLLKKNEDAKDWVAVDLLRNVARRAREGEEAARHLLAILVDSKQYNPHKPRLPKPK